MEIIATVETKKGVIHLHFHKGGMPDDVHTWSPDYSTKDKIEVLNVLRDYLTAEIEKQMSNGKKS